MKLNGSVYRKKDGAKKLIVLSWNWLSLSLTKMKFPLNRLVVGYLISGFIDLKVKRTETNADIRDLYRGPNSKATHLGRCSSYTAKKTEITMSCTVRVLILGYASNCWENRNYHVLHRLNFRLLWFLPVGPNCSFSPDLVPSAVYTFGRPFVQDK